MELHTLKEMINKEDFDTVDFYELFNQNAFAVEKYMNIALPKEDHVWDEDKSVKWNREKTQQEIERIKTEQQSKKEIHRQLTHLEERAMINAFSNSYSISEEKTKVAYDYAYSKGHAYGTSEILNYLHDVMELYENMSEV